MSRRWRIALPLLVGAAVFGLGAVVEVDDLTIGSWILFIPGAIVAPAGLLTFAYLLPFRTARAYFRHARHGVAQPPVAWYTPDRPQVKGSGFEPETAWGAGVEGVRYSFGTLVPTGLAATAFALTVWFTPTPFPAPHHVWFLTAMLVALVMWLFLAFAHTGRAWATLTLASTATLLVCATVFPLWKRTRDNSYLHLVESEASRGYGKRRVLAADQLIAIRPDDWRGYAWRVDARAEELEFDAAIEFHRPTGERDYATAVSDLLPDVEAAVRFGCDAPRVRWRFADVYEALGRYPQAAAELEAALAVGLPDVTHPGGFNETTVCRRKLGWARLHNAEYAAAEAVFRRANFEEGLGLTLIACGEYAAAKEILQRESRSVSQSMSLAWLLATCPDDSIRDPDRAVRDAASLKHGYPWSDLRDSDCPLCPRPDGGWGSGTMDATFERSKAFTLAAAYTNVDRFEEAEAAFAEATSKGRLGASGFWKPRRDELEACIKARSPYRERPAN